jgi:hypothetical protein
MYYKHLATSGSVISWWNLQPNLPLRYVLDKIHHTEDREVGTMFDFAPPTSADTWSRLKLGLMLEYFKAPLAQ